MNMKNKVKFVVDLPKKQENKTQEQENKSQEQVEREFVFTTRKAHVKYHPYVSRIVYTDGKIKRQFYKLNTKYEEGYIVTVHGTFKAKAGDIIEVRYGEGGIFWYIVDSKGRLTLYTRYEHEEGKREVVRYLKGELSLKDLEENLEYCI